MIDLAIRSTARIYHARVITDALVENGQLQLLSEEDADIVLYAIVDS